MLYYFVYGMRYPEARLQDKGAEYSFTDFPPKKELLVTHPNAEELLEYFQVLHSLIVLTYLGLRQTLQDLRANSLQYRSYKS